MSHCIYEDQDQAVLSSFHPEKSSWMRLDVEGSCSVQVVSRYLIFRAGRIPVYDEYIILYIYIYLDPTMYALFLLENKILRSVTVINTEALLYENLESMYAVNKKNKSVLFSIK